MIRLGILALALPTALVATSCGAPHSEPPAPPPTLHRPHWDQVCVASRSGVPVSEPREILDVDRLAAELADLGTPPAPDSLAPYVDVAVNYSREGVPRTVGALRSSIPDSLADRAAGVVQAGVRPLGRLVEPLRLRVRLRFESGPAMEVLRALECMPHPVHHGDDPVVFPGGVKMVLGTSYALEHEEMVLMRLHLSDAGAIQRMETVEAPPGLEERTRDLVRRYLRFDPALDNGEPVAASVLVSVFYPTAVQDSLRDEQVEVEARPGP